MRGTLEFRGYWLFVVLSVVVAFPQTLRAQPGADDFQLLTYEVGDLIIDIHDHPYSDALQRTSAGSGSNRFGYKNQVSHQIKFAQFGGGGGGGGGQGSGFMGGERQNRDANIHSITIDDLIQVIVKTVMPDTWKENGTGEGQIQPIGTGLVVWQKRSVHSQLGKLLDQLHKNSGERKTVTINARWLSLNSDDLDRLYLKDEVGSPQINRQVLDSFTRRSTSIRGITNCFSGQLVYIVSGTRKNVVSGFIPVVGSVDRPSATRRLVSLASGASINFASEALLVAGGSQEGVGYQPIVQTPNFGALLEIRPTVMRNKTAIVDLKATLTSPGRGSNESAPNIANSPAPSVDRIAIDTQELATTLRIPLGKPTLVGGLTHVPLALPPTQLNDQGFARQGVETTSESPQIYLILELR